MNDREWMKIACDLAIRGLPAPNPHVGCIIVKDNTVIGQGYHQYAGGPHAEIEALTDAGDRAKGAEVFCTLEPCNHLGRTGPCSEALINAGVRRVVYAVMDPNPKARGGGQRLREAGVETLYLPFQRAVESNTQFLFAMAHRRPMVTAKYAMTLDGAIATHSGESQWITCEESRSDAQLERAACGAVLVGRKTAEVDKARLNVRVNQVQNQPLRIVLDQFSKLSEDLPIFDSTAPTWRVTAGDAVWLKNRLDVHKFLEELFQKGVHGVLIEGGAETLATFFEANVVDRILGYIAPKILGGGLQPVGDFGIQKLVEAREFVFESTKSIGQDMKWVATSRNLDDWRSSYLEEANQA
jgi:diaminohydroxyphosphoribosylaminopyrimidine deaminase / 5-amino-6-(5-phosphoribosylamino)uracil reductase